VAFCWRPSFRLARSYAEILTESCVDEPFSVVPYKVPDSLSSSAGPKGAGSSKRSCVASAPTSVG
jgi:hypothetical protein